MAFIETIPPERAAGKLAELYEEDVKKHAQKHAREIALPVDRMSLAATPHTLEWTSASASEVD